MATPRDCSSATQTSYPEKACLYAPNQQRDAGVSARAGSLWTETIADEVGSVVVASRTSCSRRRLAVLSDEQAYERRVFTDRGPVMISW